MRLAPLERGQRPKQRLILLLIRLTQRREPPDVLIRIATQWALSTGVPT